MMRHVPGLSRRLMPAVVVAAAASLRPAPVSAVDLPERPWSYDARGRCDPFVPLVRDGRPVACDPSVSTTGELKAAVVRPVLGGILWDPDGHSIALINGTEAKVGDVVGGFEIQAIHRDEVVLTHEEERVVLRINFEEQQPKRARQRSKGGAHP